MQPEEVLAEHLAYQRTMLSLMRDHDVDVVHLNCVHPLPVAMAPAVGLPVTSTLHSPPTPWLELAYQEVRGERGGPSTVAVSRHLADAWRDATGEVFPVIPNGVDLARWTPGQGDGGYTVWSGRLVPEKAPHLAMDAAMRAGLRLVVAGPAHHPEYFEEYVRPRLSDSVTWVGHLSQRELSRLVGGAGAVLVTPAWDEPFGLVAIEAMACGTPVAAIGRGALPGIVTSEAGIVVPAGPDVVDGLAAASHAALRLDRRRIRALAEERFDLRTMVRRYERLMLAATLGWPTPEAELLPA